jgi:uncharacterized protein YegJ (DUF2314 family)
MRTIPLILLVVLAVAGCSQKQRGWTPEVVAAAQQAQASLTNFTDHLESSKSNLAFCQVCAVFPSETGQGGELVWAHVWKYDGAWFSGAVVEAQPSLGLTNNQPVTIAATNVVDWMYLGGTGIVGRFLDAARH